MEKSIKRLSAIGYRLSVLGALLCCIFPARADDASTLLSAPKLPPYQWFASTDPKHQNADYILLKPGETRRVALGKGVLVRLWSTALEPEKIELALQNGARIEILKNGKSKLGNYYQKAFTFYPGASTPAGARDLKNGAALIVTNKSVKENKWFYQVAVRDGAKNSIKTAQLRWPSAKVTLDVSKLFRPLRQPTIEAYKKFRLLGYDPTLYPLSSASGSARSQKGVPIPILNVTGEGAFVGLVLDIRPAPDAHRRTFAFLEGNEILTADNKKYEGTGTEDFFNSAWYFPDKPFSQPYHGLTQKSTNPPSVTAYRWMIPDAVPFKKNFKFEFEHGNGNNDNDLEYRWVAFWYQKPDSQFEIRDELKPASTRAGAASSDNQSDSKEMLNFNPVLLRVSLSALVGGVIVMISVWLRRRKPKEF